MTELNVRDLDAWKVSMDLVTGVYKVSSGWPKEERYGLTSQIRRAAVSVPSNIAEGQGRATTRDFVHFLGISYGSLMEVHTQLLIAERLGYQSREQTEEIEDIAERTAKVINGLKRALRRKMEGKGQVVA